MTISKNVDKLGAQFLPMVRRMQEVTTPISVVVPKWRSMKERQEFYFWRKNAQFISAEDRRMAERITVRVVEANEAAAKAAGVVSPAVWLVFEVASDNSFIAQMQAQIDPKFYEADDRHREISAEDFVAGMAQESTTEVDLEALFAPKAKAE